MARVALASRASYSGLVCAAKPFPVPVLRLKSGQRNVRSFSSMWDRRFTKTHEWIQIVHSESDAAFIARVGISQFAQDQLGEIQVVEFPKVDTSFKPGDEMVSIESIKTISSCNAVSECHVVEVNKALEEDPSLINSSPEGDGWIVEVKFTGGLDEYTMDRAVYEAGCEDGSIPP
eukprot:CAMPEP_0197630808 /NCGR_PEP_ID=MMETSP1338-20131121/8173_1 /TAXON_ID=43686 ORGANISM="Pelagodinium beii, Strain RCC1491" /NCGR_SAMPLE_ID=MMETSP1338 /ASSEMBLY_ACC=CAM_ASM_000754 /LENGTH=174 /DNA_ID=CAMNT_0043202113 /DNA_START=60 /DNA_END=584 /DNA_ORIENTATION=-